VVVVAGLGADAQSLCHPRDKVAVPALCRSYAPTPIAPPRHWDCDPDRTAYYSAQIPRWAHNFAAPMRRHQVPRDWDLRVGPSWPASRGDCPTLPVKKKASTLRSCTFAAGSSTSRATAQIKCPSPPRIKCSPKGLAQMRSVRGAENQFAGDCSIDVSVCDCRFHRSPLGTASRGATGFGIQVGAIARAQLRQMDDVRHQPISASGRKGRRGNRRNSCSCDATPGMSAPSSSSLPSPRNAPSPLSGMPLTPSAAAPYAASHQ